MMIPAKTGREKKREKRKRVFLCFLTHLPEEAAAVEEVPFLLMLPLLLLNEKILVLLLLLLEKRRSRRGLHRRSNDDDSGRCSGGSREGAHVRVPVPSEQLALILRLWLRRWSKL